MKHVQIFEKFLNEKISKSDLKKIESYLNKQDEDTLFAFAEDAYGESDDDEMADEWNDVKDDLSIDELKDYIIDHVKRFELDFEEFKDAMGIYESKFLNENQTTSALKSEIKDVKHDLNLIKKYKSVNLQSKFTELYKYAEETLKDLEKSLKKY